MLENVGTCPLVARKLLSEFATTKVRNFHGLEQVQGFVEKEIILIQV